MCVQKSQFSLLKGRGNKFPLYKLLFLPGISLKQHKYCVQLKTEVWKILIAEYKDEEIKRRN